MIAEFNKTFKIKHSYICHKNGQDITNKCWFKEEKFFMYLHSIQDKASISLTSH
ncbi:hypothetical protein [Francisella tularensis]|uniref:hypothetical protein n=1 Tax=Francisella tularensis TaxID=263 RepID=UPI002965D6A1|nr:hypothetical protein [Francisella tularensis]